METHSNKQSEQRPGLPTVYWFCGVVNRTHILSDAGKADHLWTTPIPLQLTFTGLDLCGAGD